MSIGQNKKASRTKKHFATTACRHFANFAK